MEFIKTDIPDVIIYKPRIFPDDRGYFFESYTHKNFQSQGLDYNFIQDNQSKSVYGVLRGLHFQKEPYSQTKLVRVIQGKILDVAVDIRKNSHTYKKWVSVELSDDNFYQLLIPKGFAHGFVVLSKEAIVSYKCDGYYNKDADCSIRFDDPGIGVNWQIDQKDVLISEKDRKALLLKDTEH